MPYVRKPAVDISKLAQLMQAQLEADRAVTEEVARLRHAGASWLDIAEVTGGQRQAAQRRYQNLEAPLYTARGQRTAFGWIVSVAGVPAAVFHYPSNEQPSKEWVHVNLGAVLDRSPEAFRVQLDFDYEGLAL
jgi:hypothetical protein